MVVLVCCVEGGICVVTPCIDTYMNVWLPQPAIRVKNLGAKSRAGLMAKPQFIPKVKPILSTTKPTIRGIMYEGTFIFFLSVIAQTHNNRIMVPKT